MKLKPNRILTFYMICDLFTYLISIQLVQIDDLFNSDTSTYNINNSKH